jgi:hypothetical protein
MIYIIPFARLNIKQKNTKAYAGLYEQAPLYEFFDSRSRLEIEN